MEQDRRPAKLVQWGTILAAIPIVLQVVLYAYFQLAMPGRLELSSFIVFSASTLLGGTLFLWFLSRMSKRLNELNENVQRFSEGKRLRSPDPGNDELAQAEIVFHRIAQSLLDAQEKLSISESRLLALLNNIPVGLLLLKPSGYITATNDTLARILGRTEDELIGQHIDLALPQLAWNQLCSKELAAEKRTVEVFPSERTISATNDQAFDIRFQELSLPEGPRILLAAQDVSERHELERLRNEFVSMVVHDLKTPLTSIRLFHQLLRKNAFGELPGTAAEPLESSERSVERLLNLVNGLLDAEKATSGHLQLNRSSTRLSSVIKRSLESINSFAREQAVSIEAINEEAELFADEERLIQVVVNLLSNAVKFSGSGSHVSISATRMNSGWLEVSIQDQGRGIPPDQQSLIFHKYKQVEVSDSQGKRGIGLGLPICKAIIEQHGGSIGLESEPGKGSRFWFRVPLESMQE